MRLSPFLQLKFLFVRRRCAYCEKDENEKRDALQIAILTYKELNESDHAAPNQITFATVLTALRNLMPKSEERDAAVMTVFKNAATAGCVGEFVLRRTQSALEAETIRKKFHNALFDDGSINIELLPSEWRRNVDKSPVRKKVAPIAR